MASTCDNLVASMRHRVTLQFPTKTTDGQGGFTETWTNGDTVYASITTLKAYQRFQAMQMQTPETHRIVMRYRSDVSTGMRLKFQDRIFWVQEAINVDMRNRFLEIKVNERA